MIKRLGNLYVAIVGFREVEIMNVDDLFNLVRKKVKGIHIQFFDATTTAGWEHLYFAALNALSAFENNLNISNSLAMEALLFASAQRQISKAVKMIGVLPETSQVAVLIIAEKRQKIDKALKIVSEAISGERDDSTLEITDEKIEGIKRLFDISDIELKAKLRKEGLEKEALIDLVIEHVALLATRR